MKNEKNTRKPVKRPRGKKNLAQFLLILVTVVWGLTFSLVKMSLKFMGPFTFLSWRFIIASVAMTAIGAANLKTARRKALLAGVILGVILYASYTFQTVGLKYTTAGNAGFITGLFIVFVPILSFLALKQKPDVKSVFSVIIALTGLGFLSIQNGFHIKIGDLLVLACAFSYSVHIILLDRYVKKHDLIILTMTQMWVLAICSLICASLFENLRAPKTQIVWISLIICGIFASAVAFYIQGYAQRVFSPVKTAMVLIMEPVFSVGFGMLLLAERLSARGWLGCALIFAGMLLTELPGEGAESGAPRKADMEAAGLENLKRGGTGKDQ